MLRHVGTKVLAGFDPQDYSAPAIIIGWEDQKLKGQTLIDALPCFEPAKHNDGASRRRAVAEDRRAKAVAKKFARTDLDEKVAGWRAEAMAGDGRMLPPFAPKVVQLDTRGLFSPAPALFKNDQPTQGARLRELLDAEEDERNRTVSGGNR